MPWNAQQPGQQAGGTKKRCDPVKRYHYYLNIWRQHKFPGEYSHSNVRWHIREKMLHEDPSPCVSITVYQYISENHLFKKSFVILILQSVSFREKLTCSDRIKVNLNTRSQSCKMNPFSDMYIYSPLCFNFKIAITLV
jgi:hypothetical protein